VTMTEITNEIAYLVGFILGDGDFSLISIHGKNQCKIFSEKVGFKHPSKSIKLKNLL